MCGLVYSHNLKGAKMNHRVKDIFEKQIERGTDGFGMFDGKHIFKASKMRKAMSWLKRYESNMLMFHHRLPTSTINVKRAAHPFTTKDFFGDNQYITIHNGSIKNSKVRKKVHEEDFGIEYQTNLHDGTFNDSEALAWDIALYLEGLIDEIPSYGNIAFITIRKRQDNVDTLYFGRNHYPLKLKMNENNLTLSSKGGKGKNISQDTLYTYKYATNRLDSEPLELPSYNTNYSYQNSYTYYPPESSLPQTQGSLLTQGDNAYDYNYDGSRKDSLITGTTKVSDLLSERLLKYETDADARDVVFNYLQSHEYYFGSALDSLETDYSLILQDAEEFEDEYSEYNISVLERAMEMIWSDDEYENVNSRSSRAWAKYGSY